MGKPTFNKKVLSKLSKAELKKWYKRTFPNGKDFDDVYLEINDKEKPKA